MTETLNPNTPAGTKAQGKSGSTLARWGAPPVLPNPEECLRLAQAGLRMIQNLLTYPSTEALLRTELCLRHVADHLRQFSRSLARTAPRDANDRALLSALAVEVKDELAQAHALFQRVTQYYAHWIRLYSARRCGYTRTGSPARLTCQQGLAVQG